MTFTVEKQIGPDRAYLYVPNGDASQAKLQSDPALATSFHFHISALMWAKDPLIEGEVVPHE
jgi:hypothetical protein